MMVEQSVTAETLPIPTDSIYSRYVKRVLDFLCSFAALVLLLPLIATICILELIIHGRPILYASERPGKAGRLFKIYKFRSMTNETDAQGELLDDRNRLTDFGRFLRRTSIDELPELISVLKGDMAIVGPRPLLTEYLEHYSQRHMCRHLVRPGLACLRIRRFKDEVLPTTWTWNDQFENDIWYIQHISFITDVKMVIAIAKAVFVGSEIRTDAARVIFQEATIDETKPRF